MGRLAIFSLPLFGGFGLADDNALGRRGANFAFNCQWRKAKA
jgi:hypothetical protein